MALFAVTRYMGDEDQGEKQNQADLILKKLQKQAKAKKRRSAIIAETSPNKSFSETSDTKKRKAEDEDSPVQVKRSKQKNISKDNDNEELNLDTSQSNVIESELKSPKSKKKKKKTKDQSSDGDTSLINLENTSLDTSQQNDSLGDDSELKSPKSKKTKKTSKKDTKEKETVKKDSDDETSESEPETTVDKIKKKKNVNEEEDDEESKSDTEDRLHDSGVEDEEMDEDADEAGNHGDRSEEGTGFTVIGSYKKAKVQKVQRVLPEWLSSPSIVAADIRTKQTPLSDIKDLDDAILDQLKENNITHFFPVQAQVIPELLDGLKTCFLQGKAGYRPCDICCSAPTGSGKTLAFVLPIVQALKSRVVCRVRALVMLPVRDLATQVYKVFQTYCKGTHLKVGLIIGQKTFNVEQQSLVRKGLRGIHSKVDIIVATPGRLVDHINKTPGFNLEQLRFMVIDEADRMMDEIKQDWLAQVEKAVYTKNRPRPSPITAASVSQVEIPLQKLLFSATLSQNPEKLQQLNLFHPRLYTSVVSASQGTSTLPTGTQPVPAEGAEGKTEEDAERGDGEKDGADSGSGKTSKGEFAGKYTTPAGLTEFFLESTPAEKPLRVLYFLHVLKFRHVLCFTNSKESTHRLFWLVKLFSEEVKVKEFSSRLPAFQRKQVIEQFSEGKIDLLICSDAMARGMDVENVKYVISYDSPAFIKTYIHRVGRTARAGKVGTALTLLEKKEVFHFKKMVKEAGKTGVKELKIAKAELKGLVEPYQDALRQLPEVLKAEKERGH